MPCLWQKSPKTIPCPADHPRILDLWGYPPGRRATYRGRWETSAKRERERLGNAHLTGLPTVCINDLLRVKSSRAFQSYIPRLSSFTLEPSRQINNNNNNNNNLYFKVGVGCSNYRRWSYNVVELDPNRKTYNWSGRSRFDHSLLVWFVTHNSVFRVWFQI